MNLLVDQNQPGVLGIDIIPEQDYDLWLAQQTTQQQNWLTSQCFSTSAGQYALLADHNGQLEKVILIGNVEKNPDLLTSLVKKLPPRDYRLINDHGVMEQLAFAWALEGYDFARYKQTDTALARLVVPRAILTKIQPQIDACFLVRDLVNTPAEDMTPQTLENIAHDLAQSYQASCSVITGQHLITNNFPAIYAVGRASQHAPRLIELCWGEKDHPKISVVGKGVCFDTGGLDLKPSSAMLIMKKDMGGAAHALALAKLIMHHQLPIYLQLLIPAVENVIDAHAYRPGDIVKTRKGLSIEIGNTDAEGRVILSDALAYASESKPNMIIDFATLTGAARVALGHEIPAFFSNDQALSAQLEKASQKTNDPVWQLPLHSPYKELIKSHIADINNSGSTGLAGSITAALFLQHFISDHIPWLHFDLSAWNDHHRPGHPTGGEAMGLRAVFEMLNSAHNALMG